MFVLVVMSHAGFGARPLVGVFAGTMKMTIQALAIVKAIRTESENHHNDGCTPTTGNFKMNHGSMTVSGILVTICSRIATHLRLVYAAHYFLFMFSSTLFFRPAQHRQTFGHGSVTLKNADVQRSSLTMYGVSFLESRRRTLMVNGCLNRADLFK